MHVVLTCGRRIAQVTFAVSQYDARAGQPWFTRVEYALNTHHGLIRAEGTLADNKATSGRWDIERTPNRSNRQVGKHSTLKREGY